MAVANATNGTPVIVGEDTIMVSQNDGIWAAGFKDYFAKGVYSNSIIVLQRKAKLVSAIESVSKCRVHDSTIDDMGIVLHAHVRCP